MEAEHFDSLDAMRESADAVVLGRIVAVAPGRVWGNPPEDAAWYANATVQVDELFTGSLYSSGGSLQLELFMAEPQVLDSLAQSVPTDESAVFFLRNKGSEAANLGRPVDFQAREAPYYRLVIASGLLRQRGEVAATAFAADEPYLLGMAGVRWNDLVTALRTGTSLDALAK